MNVRPAHESDMEQIRAAIARFRLDDEDLDRGGFVVAEVEGRLAGFARLRRHPGCLELASLGVLETFRNRGVGRALVDHVVSRAPARSVYAITEIPGYFGRLGFTAARRPPRALRDKVDRLCPSKGHAGGVILVRRIGKKPAPPRPPAAAGKQP